IEALVGYEPVASGYFFPTDQRDIEFEIPEMDWPRVKHELDHSRFDYTIDNKEVDMPKSQTQPKEQDAVHGDAYEGPVAGDKPAKAYPRFFPIMNREDAGVRFVRDHGDPKKNIEPGYFIALDEKPDPALLAEIKPILRDARTRFDSEVQGWVR